MCGDCRRREHAPPAKSGDQADSVQRLIDDLGSADYFDRQRAQTALAKHGADAFDALTAATTSEDLEIAARAKYLLRLIRVQLSIDNDSPEVRQVLQDYEAQGPEQRQSLLGLARMPDEAGLPALCRMVRFEDSGVLSSTRPWRSWS